MGEVRAHTVGGFVVLEESGRGVFGTKTVSLLAAECSCCGRRWALTERFTDFGVSQEMHLAEVKR